MTQLEKNLNRSKTSIRKKRKKKEKNLPHSFRPAISHQLHHYVQTQRIPLKQESFTNRSWCPSLQCIRHGKRVSNMSGSSSIKWPLISIKNKTCTGISFLCITPKNKYMNKIDKTKTVYIHLLLVLPELNFFSNTNITKKNTQDGKRTGVSKAWASFSLGYKILQN